MPHKVKVTRENTTNVLLTSMVVTCETSIQSQKIFKYNMADQKSSINAEWKKFYVKFATNTGNAPDGHRSITVECICGCVSMATPVSQPTTSSESIIFFNDDIHRLCNYFFRINRKEILNSTFCGSAYPLHRQCRVEPMPLASVNLNRFRFIR